MLHAGVGLGRSNQDSDPYVVFMANRFPNQTCVFCSNLNDGVGEHIWPLWFIKEFHGQGPFTTSREGVPYTKSDMRTPYTSESLLGVHVPACTECNAALNTTIEEPAKPVVRRLLAHRDSSGALVLSVAECAALARWLLKVGILSAHPAADHDHPWLQRDTDLRRLPNVQPEWLDWMRTGSAPPEGFSVFVTRRDLRGEEAEPALEQHIILPQLVIDGEDPNFMSRSFGFTGLNVTIVWHPGWPIEHAQVEAGRAARLWPGPYEMDFGALPQVHPKEFAFWDGSIGAVVLSAEKFAGVAQQPLSVNSDPYSSFFGNALSPEQ
jgi:hypothetical protein